MRYVDDDWCFGCGHNNPIGLHLEFDATEDGVRAIFVPQRNHQGFRGMLHGGLMMTLLDEAIAWAVTAKYGPGVTGELRTRIRNFGEIGKPLTVVGRVTRKRMRMVEGESAIIDSSGAVVAEAAAKFMLSADKSIVEGIRTPGV